MSRIYTTLPYIEKPTASGNYGGQRSIINTIILHSTAGTASSAVAWFGNPRAGTSAHYIIGNDGVLYAMLEEYLTGYHAGNYTVNQKSIGIEHEGYDSMIRSDKEYNSSIKLVADICKFYNIPCDREHIKPHKDIVATACPTDLDINRIISGAQKLLNPPAIDYKTKYEQAKGVLYGSGTSWTKYKKLQDIIK